MSIVSAWRAMQKCTAARSRTWVNRAAMAVLPMPGSPVMTKKGGAAGSASQRSISAKTHSRPVKSRVRSAT